MDDAELHAIRAARLQELRSAAGAGETTGGEKAPANPNDAVLAQLLTADAKQRLSRVRMVKPERVAGVERYLLDLYRGGALHGKVDERALVEMLDRTAQQERAATATTIRFARRGDDDGDGEEGSVPGAVPNANAADSDDDFFD